MNSLTFLDAAYKNGRGHEKALAPIRETPYLSSDTVKMYRNNPLQNIIELNDVVSPFVKARLYATTEARLMNNMVAHGSSNTLMPIMTVNNLEDMENEEAAGLAGEVAQHYNYAVFDKERDL